MTLRNWWRASCSAVAMAAILHPIAAAADAAEAVVEIQPQSSVLVRGFVQQQASGGVQLTHAAKLALVKKNIKYVFVLFQENRSFDQHFGTFPGVNGLFSGPAAETPGFVQPIVHTDGSVGRVSPFLITQSVTAVNKKIVPLYPADTDSVDHSHTGIDNSLDVVNGRALNDRYALNAEGFTTRNGAIVTKSGAPLGPSNYPSVAAVQKAELTLSHLDCDTVPFLWQYADRFVLFDNFHQTIIGPSTPNAIALIAGQSGQTQWALHPGEASNNTASPVILATGGEPIVADPGPWAGSNFDHNPVKPPYGLDDSSPAHPALNQTYATLPLSFMGRDIQRIVASDQNPAIDLADVQNDIRHIAGNNLAQVPWGWYQQGFDAEPTDGPNSPTGTNYIVHHNGPQYFGYIASNTYELQRLHGLQDFYTAVSHKSLTSGVYYVRGGYGNNDDQVPVGTAAAANFHGNDDHPGYSDAQISETLLADEINAIVDSPYWSQSAIIITYDETDGLYDHAPIHIRDYDPEGSPLSGGPRIPAIIVSPFAKAHAVSHEYGEHSSVIKFINELYGQTSLANLPDERKARALALANPDIRQSLGPADAEPYIGDLLSAFDDGRLQHTTPPLPSYYAAIPANLVTKLPHYGSFDSKTGLITANGCLTLNIVPTDYLNGALLDPPPADFNPRPGSSPGTPTSGTWTP